MTTVQSGLTPATSAMKGTILVHIPTEAGGGELHLAMTLADASGARVIGVVAEGFDPSAFAGGELVSGPIMQAILSEQRQRMTTAMERARRQVEAAKVPVDLFEEQKFPEEALDEYAAGADWILAVRPAAPGSQVVFAEPGELALRTGLPILVAPPNIEPLTGRRVVIGWRDNREARRAVADAMPLLMAAEDVLAVSVSPDARGEADRVSLERLVARLVQRGCKARFERLREHDHPDVSKALQDRAHNLGADLIVAGAYAHSRLGEWIFGGVTRDLTVNCGVYVLMSH